MVGLTLALVLVVGFFLVLLILFLLFGSSSSGAADANTNLRNLVVAQREGRNAEARGERTTKGQGPNLAFVAAADAELDPKKTSSSNISLDKKLRYARWPLTPLQFRAIQFLASLLSVILVYRFVTIFIVIMVMVMAPLMVGGILDKAVNRRFELFDVDYPVMLMSFVSLLKTGMSVVQGLEAAAQGLDENSLVRSEVMLLIERLRLGLTEEQAIGSFGEDIAHPEIELFVQSLILSRRVGGTLSATLERLARQVRKRQQFRKQAVAAVGLERGSLNIISFIMTGLLVYLAISSPQLIFPAFKHPLGQKIFQAGIMMIVFGMYWSRKVTELKI